MSLLVLEALASPQTDAEKVLQEPSKKFWAQQETNLKIDDGKQGKHVVGHNNYDPTGKKSIFEHSDPERLIKKFAGTGERDPRSTGDKGQPGYKENVNFQEFIERISTTCGKIHYAKNGVHIVPRDPSENWPCRAHQY